MTQSVSQPIRLLFFSLMTILLSGYSLFCWQTWLDIKTEQDKRQQYLSRLMVQSIRSSFINQEHTLRLLGQRLLQEQALQYPEKGRTVIELAQQTDPGMAGFGLAGPGGQLVLISGLSPGQDLPNLARNSHTAKSFVEALNAPNLLPGRNYFMRHLDEWVMPIRVALRDQEGAVEAVMTAGNQVTGGSTVLSNMILPANHKMILLRNDGFAQFVSPSSAQDYSTLFETRVIRDKRERIRVAAQHNKLLTSDLPMWPGQEFLIRAESIPEYKLHALVLFPTDRVSKLWIDRVWVSFVLFVFMLVASVFAYRFLNRAQMRYQNELQFQLYHDPLTQLPNRRYLMDHLQTILSQGNQAVAVLFIDLDDFKRINDTFGHETGDDLLCKTAQRLCEVAPSQALVARQGGDEFIAVHVLRSEQESAMGIAQALSAAFQKPLQLSHETRDLISHLSIGLVQGVGGACDADELLRKANAAMHKVKQHRKNGCLQYSDELDIEINRRIEIEDRLEVALQENALSVVYQPQANCQTGKTEGLEALLRWNDSQLGFVSPAEFVPIAEASQQIEQIDHFVIQRASQEIAALREELGLDLSLSVNFSAHEIIDENLPDRLRLLLRENNFPAADFIAEMTETALVADYRAVRRNCDALKTLGIRVSLDDFGTGYSSLSLLHELPVSEIKIDRSFIKDFVADETDAALVNSIIAMGHGLGLHVVGEGVETEAHREKLQSLHCDYYQGYELARPLPLNELKAFLLPISSKK